VVWYSELVDSSSPSFLMPHPYRRRRKHKPGRRHGPSKPDRRRALELLAASPDGCSEALMFANEFTVKLLIELIRTELATAQPERLIANGKQIEIIRVRITEAGRQAVARVRSHAITCSE